MLSNEEREHFINRGWLKISQGIPRAQALRVQSYIIEHLNQAERGEEDKIPVAEMDGLTQVQCEFAGEPFDSCLTPRLKQYLDSLTAPYWRPAETDIGHWGWWSINTHYGSDLPWDIPTEGWHWDGASFQHSVTECHKVGIVMLCLFSDLESKGGATLLAEGTHKAVISTLRKAEMALELTDALRRVRASVPWIAHLTGEKPLNLFDSHELDGAAFSRESYFGRPSRNTSVGTAFRVVEAIGEAGDVFLCHPYLIHAASYNHRNIPRILCNRFAPFAGPLKLQLHSQNTTHQSILDEIVLDCERCDS